MPITPNIAYAWGVNTAGQLGDNSKTHQSSPVSVAGGRSFVSAAVGYENSAAIQGGTGNAYCWGMGSSGVLGNNSKAATSSPVSVAGDRSFVALSVGFNHAVAIQGSDGCAYTWGSNLYGQLGDNTKTGKSSPVAVVGDMSFVAISAGDAFTAAIQGSDGCAYCWGVNWYGALGNQSTTGESSPVSVAGGRSFVAIAAGSTHTVAIQGSDGCAYAWGYGQYGRLGNNTTTNSSSPVSVAGGRSFVMVSAGYSHSAAIQGSDGCAYCWGVNTNGRLGDNTISYRSSPVSVAGGRSFIAIAAGYQITVAIQGGDFAAYAWGAGINGALGNNTTTDASSPVSVAGGYLFSAMSNNSQGYNTVGILAPPAQNATVGIATSTAAAFSIRARNVVAANTAVGWGLGTSGQLGDNSNTSKSSPVSVAGGQSFLALDGGVAFSVAIQGNDCTGWAWGLGTSGQLGNNTTTSTSSPVSIAGDRGFIAIATGRIFAVALQGSDGCAYAWGYNSSGQLGDNSTTNTSSPVAVAGGRSFSKIAAGTQHAVAIQLVDGCAYAWGNGAAGQLGNNTKTSSSSPVSVAGGMSFVAIGANGNNLSVAHTVAINGADGSAWGWGSNASGQLGNNTKTGTSSPVSVAGGLSFVAIAAGTAHTAAINGADGCAYCWGLNSSGQLGDNSTTDTSSPVSVAGGRSFIAITAGLTHTVAIQGSDHTAWAWGGGASGQLGNLATTNSSSPVSVAGGYQFATVNGGTYANHVLGILYTEEAPAGDTATIGLASSTPAAFGITASAGAVTATVGIASSSATAYEITANNSAVAQDATVGIASRTATAYAITATPGVISATIGIASRVAEAFGITASSIISAVVGIATRTAEAFAITGQPGTVSATVGLAESTPQALSISAQVGAVSANAGLASHASSALAITATPGSVSATVGLAAHGSQAFAITPQAGGVSATVGIASRTPEAFDITGETGVTVANVGLASRTPQALSITLNPGAVSASIGIASRTPVAYDISATPTISGEVGLASRSASAYSIVATPGPVSSSVGVASRVPTAYNITAQPGSVTGAVGIAIRSAEAYGITPIVGTVSANVGIASVTPQAYSITATVHAGVEQTANVGLALRTPVAYGILALQIGSINDLYPSSGTRKENYLSSGGTRSAGYLPSSGERAKGYLDSSGHQKTRS